MRRLLALAIALVPLTASAHTVEEVGLHWAPVLYQDTADGFPNDWHNRRYDLVTRFDFDGDDIADDNWENAAIDPIPAFVYYDVLETKTHWFVFYGFYHPRDWEAAGCFYPACHENDQENYRIAIAKDGSEWGHAELLDGDAHGFDNAWAIDPAVTASRGSLKSSPLATFEGDHVRLSVEAKGHGPYACGDDAACRATIASGDGVIYHVTADGLPSGVPEIDVQPDGTVTGEYALLPAYEALWWRMPTDVETAFDTNRSVQYTGGRGFTFPFPVAVSWNSDDFGSEGDGHILWGVQFVSGGADRLLDWFFDPALSASQYFHFPGEGDETKYSTVYTCHPYLGVFDSCPERAPAPPPPPGGTFLPDTTAYYALGQDAGRQYPGCGCSITRRSPILATLIPSLIVLIAFARRRRIE